MNLNCELHVKSYHKPRQPRYRLYFDNELITEKFIVTNAGKNEWDNIMFKVTGNPESHELILEKLDNNDIYIIKYVVNNEIKYKKVELLVQSNWIYRINT